VYGSLAARAIQTDTFYAAAEGIPWRGRHLYLPELAVGRLVESPAEMNNYLASYLYRSYELPLAARPAAAFVSGYDFLIDQAEAMTSVWAALGIDVAGLIGGTWNADDLRAAWLRGTLDGDPATVPAPAYYSLNGHFQHWRNIAADQVTALTAAEIYAEPRAAESFGLFDHALLYSVGCHSGLSVPDHAANDPALALDWPQAVLQQSGNWVGNTGYGYGDSDLIGYSERLMLNYTEELGRDWRNASGQYIGMPIGEALTRAKRRYLRQSPLGAFGVYDEKALLVATLYGLPFLRATVPNPQPFPPDDTQAGGPPQVQAFAQPAAPRTTRTLTLRVEYDLAAAQQRGQVPRIISAAVEDSADRLSGPVQPQQRASSGRPTLPAFVLPLDLQGETIRSVSIREAQSEEVSFDPAITRLVTDHVYLEREPLFDAGAAWFPGEIAGFSQITTPGSGATSGQLLITPFQYRGSEQSGTLRAFTEVSLDVLLDAPAPIVPADTVPPYIRSVQQASVAEGVQLVVQASDDTGIVRVDVLSEAAGEWSERELGAVGADTWTGIVPPGSFIVRAHDAAGNIGTFTGKGRWTAPEVPKDIALPELPRTSE
jgi:hypothetical protein